MRAVWMVRSRQIARKLSFWWVVLSGYDARDRSLSNRIYLLYAALFWAVWFFAVFSYYAGPATTLLLALKLASLDQAAASLSMLALLGWGLDTLYQATRRSPLVFSETDAHVLCQAPVPGEAVALLWLLGQWFEPGVVFWALAVTLSFARVDAAMIHKISAADLPTYVIAAVGALLLVGLVQLGGMALAWALGALRLQRDRALTWQPRLLRLGILAVVCGLLYTVLRHGFTGLTMPFWGGVLRGLAFPLEAAFGVTAWLPGFWVALAWCILGLLALALAGRGLNLSRAAQETTQLEKIETAQRYGQAELAAQLVLERRLSGGHAPSKLPLRPGLWMLVWKDVLQSQRGFKLADLWGWLLLLAVGAGVCLATEGIGGGLLLAVWAVMAGQRATSRLQKELASWSLLRSLPFDSGKLLLGEMILPWALVVSLGWLSLLLFAGAWAPPMRLAAFVLLPVLSAAVSFASAYDLLRQARAELLLNASAPQLSSLGGFLAVLCALLPMGVWTLLRSLPALGGVLAMGVGVVLAWVFWKQAGERLRRIG